VEDLYRYFQDINEESMKHLTHRLQVKALLSMACRLKLLKVIVLEMLSTVSFESDLTIEALFLVKILYNFKALLVVSEV